MTFTNTQMDANKAVESFKSLDIDTQLALLWFAYEKMGSSITPAAPGSAGADIAEGLYNQVKELSHEEQLDVQRNLLQGQNTQLSREYGSLSDNTKLLFWYRLAQGMETEEIVPVPEDYDFPESGSQLLGTLESMEFEQQITFLRNVVTDSGSEPQSGAEV
ncbi:MAG: orange carotenoid protein N-terminal domain-containing protein [Jaaginema sp. PMC 1079.18]|nr:orange carotenoid protein N-terminal domain-containing protein [Jaaginema sp. PMC 1080.18]MEC4851171.1 orange carotenoid protein N-terminal domain-containing protein [Jaaginema sp. PMC 1079.18]MEC4866126.1 orange carotenoid protein N-terminal domain-containing protein [Jaaginema sp. PMC 1078.18]